MWSVTSYLLHFILCCWDLVIELWLSKVVGHSCSGSVKHGIVLRQKFQWLALCGGIRATVPFFVLSCVSFGEPVFLLYQRGKEVF